MKIPLNKAMPGLIRIIIAISTHCNKRKTKKKRFAEFQGMFFLRFFCYITYSLSISFAVNSISVFICAGERSNFNPAAAYNSGNVFVPPRLNALM
jgi:hypothetical protein